MTSRKITSQVDLSASNLMLGGQLLRNWTKIVNLSCPCVQMMKMSSMNLFHICGVCVYVYTNFYLNQPIKVLAFERVTGVPIAVPPICR